MPHKEVLERFNKCDQAAWASPLLRGQAELLERVTYPSGGPSGSIGDRGNVVVHWVESQGAEHLSHQLPIA
jgi:hypothetical protein